MRLAPNTTVEFSRLAADDSGRRISEVSLVAGMAYVNWMGKDAFTLNFSSEKIALDHAAHFRVDTSTEVANVAVFKGDVDVEGPSGKLTVEKKKTATFDVANDDKSTVENKIAEMPLDQWDKESVSYHDQYAKNNQTPYGYGVSDLNYYGGYSNVPGYGMMWQPYFTGIGWDPFMDGAWSWYPGYGYMFASAYPWGWMPYRYGSWMFLPGMGWMWQPGGFNTWLPVPHYAGTLPVNFHPLVAPAAGTVKTVTVGRTGSSSALQPSHLVLNAGSAGLGIARGSLDNLNHLNHQVAKSGFVEVRPAPAFSTTSARAPSWSSGRASGFGEPRSTTAGSSMGHSTSSGHSSGGGTHR